MTDDVDAVAVWEPPAGTVPLPADVGAALERCNATQTGFDPVADCGSPQACDATAGACNVCTPGVRRCLNANTLATCDATGQSETIAGCGLLEACTGGQCVPLGIPLL